MMVTIIIIIIIIIIIVKSACQFNADFINMSFLILRILSPNSITINLHIFRSFSYYWLLVAG